MAANDEFPRGEVLSSGVVTNGTAAAITFPAIPGISWVLTQVDAAWLVTTAYTGSLFFNIAANGIGLDMDGTPEPHAIGDGGRLSFSGEIPFPPDTAVQVGFTSGNGVGNQLITATAYPV